MARRKMKYDVTTEGPFEKNKNNNNNNKATTKKITEEGPTIGLSSSEAFEICCFKYLLKFRPVHAVWPFFFFFFFFFFVTVGQFCQPKLLVCLKEREYTCVADKAVSKVFGDRSRERPEGSLFNSYYTEVCVGGYSFPWIAPLYPWYVPYIAKF